MSANTKRLRGEPHRHYGIDFTQEGEHAAWVAIEAETGLNYVRDLMSGAMTAFGKAYGIPWGMVYVDDALIYTCKQLGIDYTSFEHNITKKPIDEFVAHAKVTFRDWKAAKNDVQQHVQRAHLVKLWISWAGVGSEAERYEEPDFEAIATKVVKANAKRPRVAPLRLVQTS